MSEPTTDPEIEPEVTSKHRLTKHLYVLSFDGLSTLDFDYMSTLPHFKRFLEHASYAKKVVSVYPTLTYPAHVTIMTGRYPKNHGVINNTILQPGRQSPDWYWQSRLIKGPPLFELAAATGMKVAALLWPVTARAGIQYNLPEIFANKPWQKQVLVSLLNGSPLYQLVLNHKYGKLRRGLQQPYLDDFVHQALLYTVKQKQPDLTLVHYTDLDSMRHYHGVNSSEAREALKRLDHRLGDLLETLEQNNMQEESTVVVLGDHGHLDAEIAIRLNVLLRDYGYIKLNIQGQIVNFRAIAKSCDGSTYIYVNPNERSPGAGKVSHAELLQALYHLLNSFNEEHHCFDTIYSQLEAAELGADPECALMLEAKRGYLFLDSLEGDRLSVIKPEEVGVVPHHSKATHGYSPFKDNYTTVFLAAGRGIKKGQILNEMNLIDEGPTLARLLGLSLDEADGHCRNEILASPEDP